VKHLDPQTVHLLVDLFIVIRCLLVCVVVAFATWRRSLSGWIMAGMLAGAELGHDCPALALQTQLLSTIFLRLIKVIIAPLLLGTIIVGIAGHTSLEKVGRLACKALFYFEVVSSVALLIGFAAGTLFRVGVGIDVGALPIAPVAGISVPSVSQLIVNIFPENIAKSIGDEQVLQVVVFAILFAVSLALLSEVKRHPVLALADSVSHVMFKFTNIVMLFAPMAAFSAMAATVAHLGLGVLFPLCKLIGVLYLSIAFFVVTVLLPIACWAKVPLMRFLRGVAEPVAIAFATASSEAALPLAMEKMTALGVERETSSFVLATGYSFNLDGSSLYESLAVLFITQAAHVQLTIGQQGLVILTLLISSKGTAGVVRASLIIVLGVVTTFHLPIGPVGLLLAIDQLMDMGRTALNVLGNCLATVVVSRWENEPNLFNQRLAED
jgi:proton glutamate symport protein